MSKQIFIISGLIFGLLLLIVGTVLYVNRSKDPEQAAQPTPAATQPTPQPEPTATVSNKIKKIIPDAVLGAALNADGTKILYFQGKNFLATDFEGSLKNSVGAYPFQNVTGIEWNQPRNQALVKVKGAGYYAYSLDSDQAFKLKDGTDVVTWSSKGDKIIYKYFQASTGMRSINIADPNGESWLELQNIPFKMLDFQINSQTGEIGYYPLADSFAQSEFHSMSFDGQNQRTVVAGKYGADYLWSPNGQKLLISFVTQPGGKRTEIAMVNQAGAEYKALDFPTVTQKCVWSKDSITLYCAMMTGLPDDVVLPNDWKAGKYPSVDFFWKINTQDGKKERLVELTEVTEQLDATNLFLDNDEKYLFFTDKKTGALYRLDLPK